MPHLPSFGGAFRNFASARLLAFVILLAVSSSWVASAHQEGSDANPEPIIYSPDETLEFLAPGKSTKFPAPANAFGPIAPAATQPIGALSGRIVFMNCGHGWVYESGFPWRLMRPTGLNEMNEDYGNVDQLNFFANYCFNAGAIVVPFRPIGHQTNEVVLDNDSPSVTWAGTWSDSTQTIFFGSAGDVPYRFASFANTETATATYTPNIPKVGFYPVYTWVRHGTDRGDQLYRIRHTGGESQVRIPHHMVGNGWVYLGEYYFNAGSNSLNGAVIISNLKSTTQGSVVIADAIRFGNGMGSINRGDGVSGYPREDECCRYWVQAGIGQGQSSTLYDGSTTTSQGDEPDAWQTPPRMSAEMNNDTTITNMFKRVHVSFHSNATTGNTNTATARGTTALIEASNPTPNQARLAKLCVTEVENDLIALGSPPLEYAWHSRSAQTTSGGYSELSNVYFSDEMDATIIEVAFHDNIQDAALLRDSKARAAVGKAAMHGVVRYMNEFDGAPLVYLPEPPANVRAVGETNGNISLTWAAPVSVGGSSAPTNYVIYRSTNGFGFGNPISIGNITNYTITNLAANLDYYFYVAAANAGGESMASETVGCRVCTTNTLKVLYVNAFDRFDRTTNLRQDTTKQNWDPPGPTGIDERVWPRSVNAFNYVVPHGDALHAYGVGFDTCQNEAITAGLIALTNYPIVIWACGQESTGDESFSSAEQTKVQAFLNGGGHLFVSGSEIGWDLDRASGPTSADRTFYNNYLRADFGSDTNDDSNVYTVAAVAGGIFNGRSTATFDDGTKGIYWVQTPDILHTFGTGSKAALYYNGTTNIAAIQYDGSAGGGGLVYMAVPFETITTAARQLNYMSDILDFFTKVRIFTQPASQAMNQNSTGTLSVVASGHALKYQWNYNGSPLAGRTSSSLAITNVQPSDAGSYSVFITNSTGYAITSAVATVTVNLAPTISLHPQTQTVTVGDNVTFTAGATGTAPLGYRWLKNGTPIAGATATSYTINSVLSGAAANSPGYACLVTNMAGSATTDPAVLIVNKANQTITFNTLANRTYGDVFSVSATTSSGLPVTFSIASGPATISGNTVTVRGVGSITVRASQGGSADYNAAADVEQTFSASKALLTATANNKTKVYGAAVPTLTHSYSGFLLGDTTTVVAGTPALTTTADSASTVAGGPYPITIDVSALSADNYNFTGVNGTLTVTKALLTATTASQCRSTGTTNPPFTGTLVGLQNSDNISAIYTNAATTESVSGSYPTTPVFDDPDGKLPNYAVVTNAGILKVLDLPVFSASPTNKTVNASQSATLSAIVSNSAPFSAEPLTLQWQLNGNDVVGATNNSLTISNAFATNAGTYTLIAANCGGSSSASAVLSVVDPVITTHPMDQNIHGGSNITFVVTAVGSESLTYQWALNGTNLVGKTASTLVLTNVQTADAGTYVVLVTNDFGQAFSSNAVLSVFWPLEFQSSTILNNQARLILVGEPGATNAIEVSSNLLEWLPFTNYLNTNGTIEIVDPVSETQRFYRAVKP